MDVRYVNPFIRSIKRVFETMMPVTATVGKPMVRHDACANADVEIGMKTKKTGEATNLAAAGANQ